MNKYSRLILCALILPLAACTYVPRTGMSERKWLRNTFSFDLVYIQGDMKAYRSAGSYYYFRNGTLVQVTPTLLSPDKVQAAN
ncbi:MAG TPA: hypothetical protein PKY38_08325 [Opitutaceae bacterium]|nr:hypothetical protein [Opitutaceae bacterium]